MLSVATFIGAAAFCAGLVRGAPMPDSSSDSRYGNYGSNYNSGKGNYGSNYNSGNGNQGSKYDSGYGSYNSMEKSYAYTTSPTYETQGATSTSTTTSCTSTWTSSSTYSTEAALATSTDTNYLYTSTSTSSAYYSTATYGSGSSSWGSNYDSCVQQCVASYGAPMATYTPPTATMNSGNSGNGATHTVIVAPTQGLLRYVPFAVNASVGDTIMFMWGANNHTVTKSSELQICNKTSDAPFASGEQNKSFIFTQVVNDTNPTFFYCGTPTHCEKGMFGIINPPSSLVPEETVNGMSESLISGSSSLAAMASYASSYAASSPEASAWGGSMNMSALPDWAQSYMAENVWYTRTFLAANPDVFDSEGNVNLGLTSNPLVFPQDLSAAISSLSNATSPTGAAAATPPAAASPLATSASASTTTTANTSGARSLAASGAMVAAAAGLVSFFAL